LPEWAVRLLTEVADLRVLTTATVRVQEEIAAQEEDEILIPAEITEAVHLTVILREEVLLQ
jgi:hypothetical protein